MVTSLIKSIIQLRRALSLEWEQHKDVVPAVGEPCFVADKNILKIGDGSTKFSDLEPIGVKFTADGKSIVLEDKTFKLIGFESADVGAQPRKTKNGNIEWVIPVDYADDIADLQSNINTAKVELRSRMTDAEAAIDKLEDLVGTEKVIYAIASAVKIETDRAEGVEDGIDSRVKTIESDYLKKSDKEDLQSQINTIANSPDIDNAINSINEFTQYIEEHGEIADGFRADIDTNKENINAIDARLQAVEESGGGEVNWDDIIGKPEVEAQVQPDFAQSDPTAPDYIKNRTHSISYTPKTLIEYLIERGSSFSSPSDVPAMYYRTTSSKLSMDKNEFIESIREGTTVELYSDADPDNLKLEFSDQVTYHTCTVDGIQYEYYVCGNRYYLSTSTLFKMNLGSSVNTGKDAVVVVEINSSSEYFTIFTIFKYPEETIPGFTLKCLAESITPLDEKYIPDTIARKSDLEGLGGSGGGDGTSLLDIQMEEKFLYYRWQVNTTPYKNGDGSIRYHTTNEISLSDFEGWPGVGQTCFVRIDGVEYETVCKDDYYDYIGDTTFEECPFYLYTNGSAAFKEAGPHELYIYQKVPMINPMHIPYDSRYEDMMHDIVNQALGVIENGSY